MDWPGVAKDVKDLCASCPICQKAGPAIIVKGPLNPLPVIMLLDQMVRYWQGKEENDESCVSEYIATPKANMQVVRDLAYDKERDEKMKQKFYHDQKIKERTFTVGDFVLVFRPGKTNKLHIQWQGPFPIVKIITKINYQVDLGTRLKQYRTFHVNCMKLWTPPESAAFLAYDNDVEDLENVEVVHCSHILDPHHLDIEKFKEKYKDVIQDVPGKTQIVQHDIRTGDAVPVRLPSYWLAPHSQEVLGEEIRTLFDQELIRPSKSPWAVPIVLVKKKDGTQRGSKNANADGLSRDQWSLTKVGGVSGIPNLTTDFPKCQGFQP